MTPLSAFGQWNRTKATTPHSQINAEFSNKVERIVFDSISKMKTIRAEGNAFDVSSLNNTDLDSNEALAHEMKVYARSNSYVKTFKLCGQIQSIVCVLSSPEKMIQASVVAGNMDRSQRHVPITQKVPRVVQKLSRSLRVSEDCEDSTTDPAWSKAQGGRSDPARSEPQGPDKTQRGQTSPEGHNRPSVVKGLRARQDPARSEP